jgi:MinD superfamily P-loop ATPase
MAYFIIQKNCTDCKDCLAVCINGAIINMMDEVYIDPKWCTECGSCAVLCYENAIQHEGLALEENNILEQDGYDPINCILEEELFS